MRATFCMRDSAQSAMSDFRLIPSIEQLRQRPAVRALEARFGADATVDALREAAAAVRSAIAGGDATLAGRRTPSPARIESAAAARLGAAFRPSLEPVINATGVIIHTNLGRAPLAAPAIERVADGRARLLRRSSTTSARGARGRRDVHAEALLCRLTGAEAAVVVNNNAAATLLVLAALAAGREVIVSRGELVEIGGGFRVPDVMAQSGAMLREVGTTNKTRAADYAAAISERTALILRVHPSNFRIEGFTERPALDGARRRSAGSSTSRSPRISEAAHLAARSGPDSPDPIPAAAACTGDEPSVEATVAAGVDVCCFSGDKLLGGPQAGIIVGRRGARRPHPPASADARAARRQDDVRRARGDARRVRGRPRRRRRSRSSGC